MRLIEIRSLIREVLPLLSDIPLTDMGSGNSKISNFREIFSAVEKLRKANVFIDIIGKIWSFETIRLSVNESIVIPTTTVHELRSSINLLKSNATVLVEALDELLPKQHEESVSMRLPEMSSLDTVGNFLTDIEKMLSQALVNEHLKGDIRLLNFDRGTLWLEVALGSQAALMFFVSMVRFYYECKERDIKLKVQGEGLKDVVLQVELRKSIREAIDKQVKAEQDVLFNKLLKDAKIPKGENEYPGRLKHSISTLGKMLENGLEIHPALDSETKAAQILPSPMKLLGLIRQISGQASDSNKENPIQKDD